MSKKMRSDKVPKQQGPSEMTINVRGQKREYHLLKTVESMEELETFRFKNFCVFNGRICTKRIRDVAKSFIMPCSRKKYGNKCDFELRAVRPSLESGTIHVYAHSKHNHPVIPEGKRAMIRREKELMPDANPPTILRTADNIEWQFIQTFPDYDQMHKFQHKNQCYSCKGMNNKRWRIRFHCKRRTRNQCKFMLMAMRTTTNGYHVYKHGKHNSHLTQKKMVNQRNEDQQVAGDEEDENEEDSEEEEEEEEEKGQECQEDYDDDDDDIDADENENENEEEETEEPPRNITKNIKGQIRKYRFLKTVKSLEELDKFRLENYCHYRQNPQKISRSLIIKCRNKNIGKNKCEFELMALPSADLENGTIHVYAHSEHKHSFLSESEDKKSLHMNLPDLVPAENPPSTFSSPDNLEWTFLQTFADFDKMDKFRRQNHSHSKRWGEKSWQKIRLHCHYTATHNCGFMLMAMKTTKQEYHVYKHGEHEHTNHPAPIRKEQSLHDDEQNQQEHMVEDKEDEKENKVEDEEEEEEDYEEEDDGDEDYEEEMEEGEEDEEDEPIAEEKEEKPIKEEDEEEEIPNEEEENADKILIEVIPIKQEDEEGEGPIKVEIIENPFENLREEILKKKLSKANEKVYTWMAGIEPSEIGHTIGDWDKLSLLKLVEMADQEIREHPQIMNLWLPWLKCAIPKCLPQIDGFNMRFKNLIKLTFD